MKYEYIEHNDIEQLSENISFDAETYQVSTGQLCAVRHRFIFPHITVFVRHENIATTAFLNNDDDQYFIGIPLSDMWLDGKLIQANQLFFVAPNESLFNAVPDNFTGYGMSFSGATIDNKISDVVLKQFAINAEALRSEKIPLTFSDDFGRRIQKLIDYLVTHKPILNRAASLSYEANFFSLIDELLTPLVRNSKPRKVLTSRKNIVCRAMQYLYLHRDQQVSIKELADSCYCSVRSLEYAFNTMFKMSPKQFLTLHRMHHFRKDIKSSKFDNLKDLVAQYGVSNQGRLSAKYRQLFGEYPKDSWAKFKTEKI